jgi:small subunit ribosomal protein S5
MGYQRTDGRGFRDEAESEFKEEVIHINRVAKVVKGGRKFHFTALVVVGDGKTRVGLGYGKAGEVVDAIKKGVDEAKRTMFTVYKEGSTIPYEVKSTYCSSTMLLRPAAKGHGIIAGGSARPILALSGIEDVTAKFVGSTNPVNCARATFQALKMIESPDRIGRLRGGEKVDKLGRLLGDTQRSAAEEVIEQFTAEEEAGVETTTADAAETPGSADAETPKAVDTPAEGSEDQDVATETKD